jgi:uncharacterized protein (TIRG00374 family)
LSDTQAELAESPPTPQPSRRRDAALRVLQIVASIGLLAWVIGRVDVDSVRDALGRIDPVLWTAGMAIVLAAPLVAAERTRTLFLAAGMNVRWAQVAALNLEATYFSVVLPGELVGGVVRWARVRKKLASGGGALALLLVERLVDTMVLGACTLAGAAWLFAGEGARTARWVTAGIGLAILLGAGSFLVGARSAIAKRFCHAAAARFPSGWTGRIASLVTSTLEGVAAALENRSATRRILLLSLAFWAMAWTGSILIARSVRPELPPHAFIGASAAIAILSQLPVTFAGLGLREASLPILLAAYGVTREVGLLLGLCMFLPTLLLGITGGILHALGKPSI